MRWIAAIVSGASGPEVCNNAVTFFAAGARVVLTLGDHAEDGQERTAADPDHGERDVDGLEGQVPVGATQAGGPLGRPPALL